MKLTKGTLPIHIPEGAPAKGMQMPEPRASRKQLQRDLLKRHAQVKKIAGAEWPKIKLNWQKIIQACQAKYKCSIGDAMIQLTSDLDARPDQTVPVLMSKNYIIATAVEMMEEKK